MFLYLLSTFFFFFLKTVVKNIKINWKSFFVLVSNSSVSNIERFLYHLWSSFIFAWTHILHFFVIGDLLVFIKMLCSLWIDLWMTLCVIRLWLILLLDISNLWDFFIRIFSFTNIFRLVQRLSKLQWLLKLISDFY